MENQIYLVFFFLDTQQFLDTFSIFKRVQKLLIFQVTYNKGNVQR